MRPTHKKIAAAGALGLAGLVGAAVVAPTTTAAAVTAAANAATDRAEVITNALAGLVEDRTITQEQADRVAETLDEQLPARGPGGFGHGAGGVLLGLDVAASELGLSEDDLREQLRDGATLAEIAEEQGVGVNDLVGALVDAAEEGLAAAVEEGRIDQERADEITANLEDRIRSFVEEGMPARPEGGPGRHGPWGGGRDGAEPDTAEPDSDATDATPSAV
jgi:hypothetical protein